MKSMKSKLASLTAALVLVMTIAPVSLFAQTKEDLREIRTYAGNNDASFQDGPLLETRFNEPNSFILLEDNTIVIADSGNHVIRNLNGAASSTLAGERIINAENFESYGALLDGKGEEAAFNNPGGVAIDHNGNLIIADTKNHAIRQLSPEGTVTTLAGNGEIGESDGVGNAARFYEPQDVAVDSKGTIFVADTLNHTIRMITLDGTVKTLTKPSTRVIEYGAGIVSIAGDYYDGLIAESKFNEPVALLVDKNDNLYVSDRGNQRIRYIDFESGKVTTVAGTGQLKASEMYVEGNYRDGAALQASFHSPAGLAWLDAQTLLVADSQNHTIRLIKNGEVSTLVGQAEQFGYTNGLLTEATLYEPIDVLALADGSILILEKLANQIRKLATYNTFMAVDFSSEVEVFVNGSKLNAEIQTVKGRTLIPLRALSEQLGLDIEYDPLTEQIKLSNDNTSFVLTPHSDQVEITKAGKTDVYTIDVPVALYENRAFVPVRFISEQLGLNVAWDETFKNVVIRPYQFTRGVK